jgi:YD repeat-containing protein
MENSGDLDRRLRLYFDQDGRVKRVTNPYRTGEAKQWTTNVYDEQNRVKEVITDDGAKVTTDYGVSNLGITTTVTDQALKKRRSISNALGQLIRVDEPDANGNLGDITTPNLPTYYAYDTIGNLVKITQGNQNRYFMYDSLGRLIRVRQPEQTPNSTLTLSDSITGNNLWTSSTSYDANGNIITTIDAKNVSTNYSYDNLNRMLTRTYTNEPTGQVTPHVNYTYDNLPNAKDKLIKITNSISETRYLAFNNLGRVTSSQQVTDGITYNPQTYVYNLSGALIEEMYPSGRVVKNTLNVDGNLQQIQSKKTNENFRNYANAFTFTNTNTISSMKLGNGRWENKKFNSRLQPIQIGLGNSATNQNLMKLEY